MPKSDETTFFSLHFSIEVLLLWVSFDRVAASMHPEDCHFQHRSSSRWLVGMRIDVREIHHHPKIRKILLLLR